MGKGLAHLSGGAVPRPTSPGAVPSCSTALCDLELGSGDASQGSLYSRSSLESM